MKVIYNGKSSTGKSYILTPVGRTEAVYVPISQVDLLPKEPLLGTECWLQIPTWLSEKIGL